MTTTDREANRKARQDNASQRRQLKEQRKRARERMDLTNAKRIEAETVLDHNAIVTGMVPRISGAIDSWAGKRVPLQIEHPAAEFFAATDFRSIAIFLPEQKVDIDFAADLRGLAYHEAGHILKSIPYPVLLDTVLPVDEEVGTALTRQQWVCNTFGVNATNLQRAWNVLEDQRMESSMVIDSNNLARYYNVIVLNHVLDDGMSPTAYLWLHGRKHVTPAVRRAARIAMTDAVGIDKVREASKLIDTYKASNDLHVMWECVVRFCLLQQELGDGHDSFDGHNEPGEGQPRRRGRGGEQGRPMTPEEAQERADRSQSDPDNEDEGEGKGAEGQKKGQGNGKGTEPGDGGEGEEGVDQPQSETGKGDNDHDGKEGRGGVGDRSQGVKDGPVGDLGASGSINEPWSRQTIEKALNEAKEARNQDGQIVRDLKAFNEARQQAGKGMPLQRVTTTPNVDPAVTQEAISLNRALRNLMEQARAETAPSWQTQQRHGVLDVRAYKTRKPGDMEFFSDYTEGGDMHLPNMSVSILLDGSGSMFRSNDALAAAAFGMKSACDVFGIPCTVTIYDTEAYLLWDADDRPLEVPLDVVPGGGTDPKEALDLLDLQKHDKANHLVIIMTDGAWSVEWQNAYSLADYALPDRDLVLFFYNSSAHGPKGMEACSLVQHIDSLIDLPRFLQRYIVRAM